MSLLEQSRGLPEYKCLPLEIVPAELNKFSISEISRLMLREARSNISDNDDPIDTSIVGNFELFGLDNPALKPSAICFTLKSAAPVADVIRGMYDAYGLRKPVMIGVWCSEHFQAQVRQDDNWAKKHVEELGKILGDNTDQVLVIDQLTLMGRALRFSEKLLIRAGVNEEAIVTFGGSWYHDSADIDRAPVPVARLTSHVASQMHGIGVRCVERVFKNNNE